MLREPQLIQIQTDMFYNYISCFPGNITLQNTTMECPPHVFKLSMDIAFALPGRVYRPQHNSYKVTIGTDKHLLINTIHLNESLSKGETYLLHEIERLKEINAQIQAMTPVTGLVRSVGEGNTLMLLAAVITIIVLVIVYLV